MRKLYFIIIIVLSGLTTFTQTYNTEVQTIINDVNLDSLIFYLRNLSGEDPVMINGEISTIEHRVSNWGNDLAADYLVQTLGGFGLTVVDQEYSGSGRNVFAVKEGTTYPNEYYMICAHYDAVDYYCADDNGSGTAGVLEAARLFSDLQFEYSIIYALWDEEEIGLVGSNYYATQAASNGDVIHAVINMDMIAWDSDEDMVAEIHSSILANSNDLADYIVEVDELYELQITPAIQLPGTTASDHSKFWNNGYAAVLMIEEYYGGDFNPYYHSEEDRIAILNMPYFHEMAKLSIGALASMANPGVESSVGEERYVYTDIQLTNYPNPFREETTISYSLQEENFIRVSVMNSIGEEIVILEDGQKQAGEHQLHFDADHLQQGLYFLVTQTPDQTFTRKMVIN